MADFELNAILKAHSEGFVQGMTAAQQASNQTANQIGENLQQISATEKSMLDQLSQNVNMSGIEIARTMRQFSRDMKDGQLNIENYANIGTALFAKLAGASGIHARVISETMGIVVSSIQTCIAAWKEYHEQVKNAQEGVIAEAHASYEAALIQKKLREEELAEGRLYLKHLEDRRKVLEEEMKLSKEAIDSEIEYEDYEQKEILRLKKIGHKAEAQMRQENLDAHKKALNEIASSVKEAEEKGTKATEEAVAKQKAALKELEKQYDAASATVKTLQAKLEDANSAVDKGIAAFGAFGDTIETLITGTKRYDEVLVKIPVSVGKIKTSFDENGNAIAENITGWTTQTLRFVNLLDEIILKTPPVLEKIQSAAQLRESIRESVESDLGFGTLGPAVTARNSLMAQLTAAQAKVAETSQKIVDALNQAGGLPVRVMNPAPAGRGDGGGGGGGDGGGAGAGAGAGAAGGGPAALVNIPGIGQLVLLPLPNLQPMGMGGGGPGGLGITVTPPTGPLAYTPSGGGGGGGPVATYTSPAAALGDVTSALNDVADAAEDAEDAKDSLMDDITSTAPGAASSLGGGGGGGGEPPPDSPAGGMKRIADEANAASDAVANLGKVISQVAPGVAGGGGGPPPEDWLLDLSRQIMAIHAALQVAEPSAQQQPAGGIFGGRGPGRDPRTGRLLAPRIQEGGAGFSEWWQQVTGAGVSPDIAQTIRESNESRRDSTEAIKENTRALRDYTRTQKDTSKTVTETFETLRQKFADGLGLPEMLEQLTHLMRTERESFIGAASERVKSGRALAGAAATIRESRSYQV